MIGRQRIITGTEALFAKAGIRSATMDDIAHHLGISKKTIYTHFKNKEELVMTIVENNIAGYKEKVNMITSESENIFTMIGELTHSVIELSSGIFSLQKHDLLKYYANAWSLFQIFIDDVLLTSFDRLLHQGMKEGLIRPEIKVTILVRMRLAQIQQVFDSLTYPSVCLNPLEVHEELLTHFIYGIATPKGREVWLES
ncbi:TetR/AcrR family transcriptional regulator [Mucilaginibacter gossypii]|uniref:DNA-binding transcriptional regulator, AcrR family n=1 Tax=Mucilaginibacter gossypii TaxID=551996 RepID=A0A1G8CSW8_9SPHI|nr:TetR/AcrR family transcriptional regulator [Mucilaginibacter gossypii]SDH48020.1 DNA-binding transcriptional regulator, AcrR family [Mucilaginibacter gossypii]